MNAPSSAIPPSPTAHTSGLPQPATGWRIRASASPASPSAVSIAPSQSSCISRRVPGGTASATSVSVTITNGTLMAKIQRHDAASTSQPPASGPITMAIPDHAVQEPIAAPRSSGPKVEMITASALGVSSAPNTPCSARPATSTSIVGASAHSSETSPNPLDADREHAPLAVEVGQRAGDQDQRPEREQVSVRDPLLAREAAAEVRRGSTAARR